MEIQPYTRMLEKAALAVVVCADPELQTCPGFWVQDCSAATENLLLAARAHMSGTMVLSDFTRNAIASFNAR